MKNEKTVKGKRGGNLIFLIIKSAVAAVAVTVAMVLVYAWILQKGWLNQDSIPIVNSALKVFGAAFCAFLSVFHRCGRRWIVGLASGITYILLSFAIFSIIADSFSFSTGLLSDLLMGGLTGMVTGMLVQLRK